MVGSRMGRSRFGFGDWKTAFRFGQVGFELVEGRGLKRFQARTYLYFASFIAPWMKHVRTCIDLARRAFDVANKIGDFTFVTKANLTLNSGLLIATSKEIGRAHV